MQNPQNTAAGVFSTDYYYVNNIDDDMMDEDDLWGWKLEKPKRRLFEEGKDEMMVKEYTTLPPNIDSDLNHNRKLLQPSFFQRGGGAAVTQKLKAQKKYQLTEEQLCNQLNLTGNAIGSLKQLRKIENIPGFTVEDREILDKNLQKLQDLNFKLRDMLKQSKTTN